MHTDKRKHLWRAVALMLTGLALLTISALLRGAPALAQGDEASSPAPFPGNPLPNDRDAFFAGSGVCASCPSQLTDAAEHDVSLDRYWRATMMANAAREAAAHPTGDERAPLAVVGFDTRFLSDRYAIAVSEVLAGNGLRVARARADAPTPAVSYAIPQMQAIGGVMITASHNPPSFNGFKLKAHYGGSAAPEECAGVEAWLDKRPVKATPLADAMKAGRIRIKDVRPAHYAAIKRLVDFKRIARSGLRFAHEALFGVGAGCFEELLAGTSCRVTTLNARHDAFFGGINPEPIEANYARSAAFLKQHPHDICLVTDGDADRVGGMDGRGNYLTTHQVICLLLHHLIVNRQLRGRVVKALNTTSMMDAICAAYGLEPVSYTHLTLPTNHSV